MGLKYKTYKYCAVFLGETDGVREDIEAVSIGEQIAWAESKNVTIATFTSVFEPSDLEEVLSINTAEEEWENRNFFIMKIEDSAIFFSNESIKERMLEIFEEDEPKDDFSEFEKLTPEERGEMIDNILDKSPNLTSYDQKLLRFLTQEN